MAEWLADSKSLAAQAALARALGRVGDRSSVGPLIEMLQDDKRTERARAFAAVALGILADSEALPWNTVLAVDTNTSAAPATLLDHEGFGILNLL